MKQYAFFPGCLIPARHPAMEFAIRHTLPKLGIEIVDLEGASCCPDPIYFKSKDKVDWLSVAARNLCLAEDLGLDIFTNCSGCTATLSETYHLLAENEELGTRSTSGWRGSAASTRAPPRSATSPPWCATRSATTLIRESVVRPLTGLKVAIHYGCHLLKPSRIMQVDDPDNPQVMENLVEALGATPVRHRNWYLCCGKACQEEDMPNNMMHDLLSTVNEEKADILGMICPTCFGQFDHGQMKISKHFDEDFKTPPIYYFQLLAFAQGVPYDELGFKRQRFKPEALRAYEATPPEGGGETQAVAGGG